MVAVGVEDAVTFEILKAQRGDLAQGYFFSRLMAAADLPLVKKIERRPAAHNPVVFDSIVIIPGATANVIIKNT